MGADRTRWQSEWTAKYNVYVEQLKLRAAVHQWSERATAHEVSFISKRNWTIGAGLGGLAGAILWSTLSLWLAKWLFVGAFVEGTLKAKEGFLRPTWSHELIFGAAATVLYLTLFLWTMRILVRMMMSEHHLGVDARGGRAWRILIWPFSRTRAPPLLRIERSFSQPCFDQSLTAL
ncbi:DUF6161 domain-containing protein [Sphingomonas aurantiaca]|uniref:DUF6161 domain-containing protein n=1 Tax=Sphingomonas aurantiaca TaxID=185949 RepID=UPI003A5BCC48